MTKPRLFSRLVVLMPPLDLSVLKGNDPAGYEAEKARFLPDADPERQHPAFKPRSLDDPPCYIDDPDKVHVYRRNPKWEALRLAELERQRIEQFKETGEMEARQIVLQRMATRTTHNRIKRQKRKQHQKKN